MATLSYGWMHGITDTVTDGETAVVQALDLSDDVDTESYEIALGGTVLPREKASATFDVPGKTVTVTNSSESDWYPGQNLYVQAKRTSALGGGDLEAGVGEVNARLDGHDNQIADLTARVTALEAGNPAAYDGASKSDSRGKGDKGRFWPGNPISKEEAKKYDQPTKEPVPPHQPGGEPPAPERGMAGPKRGGRTQESDGSQINTNPDLPLGQAREMPDDDPNAVDQGDMTAAHVGPGTLDPEKVKGKVVNPTQSSGKVSVAEDNPGNKDNPHSNRDHDKNPAPGKPPKAEPKHKDKDDDEV